MKKSVMKKENWVMVIGGMLVIYLSFFLISFITTNYDGLYAFFSIILTVIGIALVILGLAIGFEKNTDSPKI